jgi:large subunit ribosomal protein L55
MVLFNSQATTSAVSFVRNACYRAAFTRIKRPAFSRLYPAVIVKPDGSSINIKHNEPVAMIQMPFVLDSLSEADKKRRLMKRQMSTKKDTQKQVEETKLTDTNVKYDPRKYINMKR